MFMSMRRGIAWSLVLFCVLPITHVIAAGPVDCASQIKQAIATLGEPESAVVAEKIPAISYEDAVAGRFPRLENTPFYEYQIPEHGYITVLDLSSPRVLGHPNVGRALNIWREHTKATYLSRLKKFMPKSPEGGSAAVKSMDFTNRSVVILNTSKSINISNSIDDHFPELYGGVRIVFARKPGEKLPFQHDFPDYVRTLAAAEVGRLTGPGSMLLLIHSAMRVIEQYPEVENIFVHTSRSHVRLYRQLGALPDHEDERDHLNVILRYDKERVPEVIKHTKKKVDPSASHSDS